MHSFDVIVIGGGHAGVEAACGAARMGARAALVSFDLGAIGAMSCNPAIGGLGKGHLVREVDALDGVIGRAADAGAIHYRMLNRSKGSAVWGPRVQADRVRFKAAVQQIVRAQANLTLIEGEAAALILTGGRVAGLELADGTVFHVERIVLCTGTFLGGVLFRGEERFEGGRIGENAAKRRLNPQIFCAITRTTQAGHDAIRANLHRSPLFSGAIAAAGPRYCPSIEDKIHRFGDRGGHQVFLEPEGLTTHLVYPNGISTSLPTDVQDVVVRTMPGCAQAQIVQPGYAVEYDHIDPRALTPDLQVRAIPGLYCAGQINGTTGYEEAAAQGLVAGLEAAAAALGTAAPALDRANSYIAVMVDDLTLQGVSEPYRMLTARAEYRLRLRANNAATRLTGLGIAAGCVGEERRAWWERREDTRKMFHVKHSQPVHARDLADVGLPVRRDVGEKPIAEWLRHDGVTLDALAPWLGDATAHDPLLAAEMAEDAAYAPYLTRQDSELRDLRASEALPLAPDFPYGAVPGLSNEMIERLTKAAPGTLAAAGRVAGVTPAALSALLVHARRIANASRAA